MLGYELGFWNPQGSPSPNPAAAGLVVQLREIAREQTRTAALLRAVENVPHPNLFDSLHDVVEQLPLVVAVDSATIRISDTSQKLHLLAATGCSLTEALDRALKPLDLMAVRSLTTSELFERQATALGYRWTQVRWLGHDADPVGLILLGARTERRPDRSHLDLLDEITATLASRLGAADRNPRTLRAAALRLARSIDVNAVTPLVAPTVAELRPRERAILELYSEGLAINQIAELLIFSRHTVRTHVKSALRTLGVHTRGEAARLVHSSHVLQLL